MLRLVFLLLLFLNVTHVISQEKEHLVISIYFGGGNYYIDELQIQEVKHFVQEIPNIQHYVITVHSHTDNIGGVVYNEWLSEMRSNSAIQILEDLSIDRSMIEIKDFGQFNPVYDNTTYLGRLKNRRVDIIFWPITL